MNKIFTIFFMMFVLPAFAAISNDVVGGCNSSRKFLPVFAPNTYTCDAGYFLPANTDGCRACPSGYTCSGGTFYANDYKAQGIERQNILTHTTNNTCSANFVAMGLNNTARLHPIFVQNAPDVITVYFNNNGTIETTTCEADGELTLPEPPTRVGYTFTGWKVKNAE